MIEFLDLKQLHAGQRSAVDAAVARVLDAGRYQHGDEVAAFEREFAAYCGTRHAIAVASGFDALWLILRGLDIGPGDEVIVPATSSVSTWLAITQAGAVPVPVDPLEATPQIDPAGIEAARTPLTRAILAVHAHGHPAAVDTLQALADRHGWHLIEDAGEAVGARCQGRRTGSLGDAAAFGFAPDCNLGAPGNGGAITTDDARLAERLRQCRGGVPTAGPGWDAEGPDLRLHELQAAVLRVKLPHLDADNAARRSVAAAYRQALADMPLGLPPATAGDDPAWHRFVIRSPARDALQAALRELGIDSRAHPALACRQGRFARQRWPRLPVAERLQQQALALPIAPYLARDGALTPAGRAVVDALREACRASAGLV